MGRRTRTQIKPPNGASVPACAFPLQSWGEFKLVRFFSALFTESTAPTKENILSENISGRFGVFEWVTFVAFI